MGVATCHAPFLRLRRARYWPKMVDLRPTSSVLGNLTGISPKSFYRQKRKVPKRFGVVLRLAVLIELRLVTNGRTDRHRATAYRATEALA